MTIDLLLSAAPPVSQRSLLYHIINFPHCLSTIQLLIGLLYFLLHLLRMVFNCRIGIRSAFSHSDLLMSLWFLDVAVRCRITWQVNGIDRGFRLRGASITSTRTIDLSATWFTREKLVYLSSFTLR
jgi:hypothetical protein